ncbi:hypothetical protein GCM10023169_01040 [Georgenia halophila]|uniref:HPt domain-containing protein n=1 Tax=Georgenia halophila TaxID=620889 RepID=A0ABP8KS77_9MICO
MTQEDPVDVALAQISRRAAMRNRERAEHLNRICTDLGPGTPGQAWDEAAELAHQVAGSSGTFGNAAASAIARELLAALRARDLAAVPPHMAALTAALAGPGPATSPRH